MLPLAADGRAVSLRCYEESCISGRGHLLTEPGKSDGSRASSRAVRPEFLRCAAAMLQEGPDGLLFSMNVKCAVRMSYHPGGLFTVRGTVHGAVL